MIVSFFSSLSSTMRRRVLLIFLLVHLNLFNEAVRIEYPTHPLIEERTRQDLETIDPILRPYLVAREIQFDTKILQEGLSYFLRCSGSKSSINFIVPQAAANHLTLTTDHKKNIITATLKRNQLPLELVGRYTCSEAAKHKNEETDVFVFIHNGKSVFTKAMYPSVFQYTGIHFFNVPCQTASWFAQASCANRLSQQQCQLPPCSAQERRRNPVKCNTPICDGQDSCISISLLPSSVKGEKVFFDRQIGFALENPTIPSSLEQFTCQAESSPTQQAQIPFESADTEFVEIHQPSLTVTKEETVKLTCEIKYGNKIENIVPSVFWFDDIHHLKLIANETTKPQFIPTSQIFSRNTSITLRGFRPDKVYRFYCVRVSGQGVYARSVDITCADAPALDIETSLSGSDPNRTVSFGSDSVYDITVFTIPRSAIQLELFRNDVSLANDKRFVLSQVTNQEDQYYEYTLTIYNITFEDAADLKLLAKSSALEKSKVIIPNINGDPVGQLAFIGEQGPSVVSWRDEDLKGKPKIHPYGIFSDESYRPVCTVRHSADVKQPLNVFLQYFPCSVDSCLDELGDRECQRVSNDQSIPTTPQKISPYQTQFISTASHRLRERSNANQYLCCYEKNGLVTMAKAITVLSATRELFHVSKPEFSLVTGDVLVYRCDVHQVLYDDIRMTYHDGVVTYERLPFDQHWRVQGTNNVKKIDPYVSSPYSEKYRTTTIEVKTPPLKRINTGHRLQCIATSKRTDLISNANDTYVIDVDDAVPLRFQSNNIQPVSKLDRRTGDNILMDCLYTGRPKAKIIWFKGKLHFATTDPTIQFGQNNQTLSITRAQPVDTGYYTCELNNGHGTLRRSFDLRVKGVNPYSKIGRFIAIVVIFSTLLLFILLILFICVAIKYFRMKKQVSNSIFHGQEPSSPEDKSLSPMSQLTRIPLPANFATIRQIQTLLNFVNRKETPANNEDFKELGHGQFGVVYQVRLPDVGLVAAKLLPETIRRYEKRKKSHDLEESKEMIPDEHEIQKKKAAEMLIDEIKVMHKAGKHINIIALKKVAYPETKFKFLFSGGPIRDEDSFYLMELCSNGSLESVLKRFLNSSRKTSSLYETLTKNDQGMTLDQATDRCQLTDDDLKLIAYQVASGLDYLNRRQIAHCDIAPRNVLVNERFIMKICDFGLATWTTYRNYREQLARNQSVQLEKKNNEIATHNLTPELGKAFLNMSDADERSLLSKSSIKADVWSFGIFLWSLFLKCRLRPFHGLLEEVKRSPGEQFFPRLARVVGSGQVLQYINYEAEIPRNIYALIRLCLVEENRRPEMTRVRALLCHSEMLSKQAFEYYRMEYNRYQEQDATDENIERFGEDQGVSDLPSFEGEATTNISSIEKNPVSPTKELYYPTADDSYLPPTTTSNDTQSTFSRPTHHDSYV